LTELSKLETAEELARKSATTTRATMHRPSTSYDAFPNDAAVNHVADAFLSNADVTEGLDQQQGIST